MSPTNGETRPAERQSGGALSFIKSPQDLAAGLFLIALAVLALVLGRTLPQGTLRAMGPGMLPYGISVLVGGAGALIAAGALITEGPRLERWGYRGIFFVLGAIVLFGLTIRPLGLIVAGPIALALSGFATNDTRWKELAIFTVAMTAFCIVLFSFVLRLPIPVWPTFQF